MHAAFLQCAFGYGGSDAPDDGKPYHRGGTCRAEAGPVAYRRASTVVKHFEAEEP